MNCQAIIPRCNNSISKSKFYINEDIRHTGITGTKYLVGEQKEIDPDALGSGRHGAKAHQPD